MLHKTTYRAKMGKYEEIIRLILILLAAAACAGAGWFLRGNVAERDIAELKREHGEVLAKQETVYSESVTRILAQSQKLVDESEREVEHVRVQIGVVTASRDALRADSERLSRKVRDLAARASPADPAGPSAALGGETASGPGLVLAELWGSTEEEATDLGPALDEARARGLLCERLYANVERAAAELRKQHADITEGRTGQWSHPGAEPEGSQGTLLSSAEVPG